MLSEEQLQRLIDANEKSTGAAIQKYVNGGIIRLTSRLEEHIEDNREHNEADRVYKEADTEWKAKAQPLIDTYSNLTGAGKIMVVVSAGIATIIGAFIAVKNFRI